MSENEEKLRLLIELAETAPAAFKAKDGRIATLERELSEAKEREARLTRLLSETCGHLKGWKMSMLASTPERLLEKIEAVLKEQNNG